MDVRKAKTNKGDKDSINIKFKWLWQKIKQPKQQKA